ncbi:MAG: DNA mismatch repair ATPase [Terrestrivirus sp.]|uniref:DNA mismatch repair ATPase n=1 Tax=Terrestrivirus sp. TaxID=2487775 RepID=A0A3G4ZP64_9VIRU|nr:MAG: DNA mismatch repair ATPase [Terrestrivirus sp.]
MNTGKVNSNKNNKNNKNKNSKKDDMTITQEYLLDHETYKKKYGDKTVVLMQVGSFYECYSTRERGPNLQHISSLVNILCTRKDKSIPDIDEKNPFMMGFPMIASQKFITILVNNGYTVVIKDQVTPPPNPERKVTNIYSKGTYIDNIEKNDTNFTMCIYLEEEKQRNGTYLMCSGVSAIDLSTGKTYIHQSLSTESDEHIALDETNRFINSVKPSEIIVYYENNGKNSKGTNNLDKIINYLELDNWNYNIKKEIQKNYKSINFQNTFLTTVYKINSMLSPIEELDMDRMDYARLSLLLLLDFAKDHNENILNDINRPEQYIDNTRLILGNNAIHQLNVVTNVSDEYIHKVNNIGSLFDVVNNTSTAIGYRLLKDRLISPYVSHIELNKIYNLTELFQENKFYTNIEENLNGISDIERLNRKMLLLRLGPFELANMYDSFNEIIKLYNKLLEKFTGKNNIDTKFMPKQITINKLIEFNKKIDKTFVLSEMKKYSIGNITDTFFLPGIHKDIDKIRAQMKDELEFINELCEVLCDYVDDNKANNKSKKNKIMVKRNDRDGYYLTMSKARSEMLKINMQNVESITIKNKEIPLDDLHFDNTNKNNTKVTIPSVSLGNNKNNSDSDSMDEEDEIERKLGDLTFGYYLESLQSFVIEFNIYIKEIIPFVGFVDYVKSNAKTAILYNYKKPVISVNPNNSFVKITQLRHPIVERIIDYEYIPHNIELGNDLKGILLYGVNSCGKSTVMKALGLSIIMAQAGLFVPASQYVYSPYEMLYGRITGNDNLFKGLSSFIVEMIELKAIMKRAGPRTLVIGDEVCRGTEHISGNAIVASTIINLSKTSSSFMFTTHLHEIATMKRITDLKNVKSYHISVKYDAKTNSLIYDRHLKEGPGEPIYGVVVAKYIIQDNEFIKLATEIKNELLNEYGGITSGVTSRYNPNLILDECKICGKKNKKMHISPLETHHILFQKDCINGYSVEKPHVGKNDMSNLVVLCNECHDKLHNGEFTIDGYVYTSNGKTLKINKDNKTLLLKKSISIDN